MHKTIRIRHFHTDDTKRCIPFVVFGCRALHSFIHILFFVSVCGVRWLAAVVGNLCVYFFGNNKLINCKRFGKCWRVASGETIYNSIAANSTTWSTANNISGFALFYFSTVRVNCCFWSVSVSAFSTACACASLAFFPLVIFIQL